MPTESLRAIRRIAVVLDLVDPTGPRRRMVGRGWQARLNEAGRAGGCATTCKFRYRADAGKSTLPYHRTDPNHRSIVSAIAVQTTLVTTRNTKPKPNIASARYSVPTVPPTPTTKAHAARPMRRMFSWKRRLARLQGGFGRDSIGGKHKLHLHNITSQQGRSATEPWHQGATYPVASDPWRDQPPVVQRRTWEALANSGAFPLVK